MNNLVFITFFYGFNYYNDPRIHQLGNFNHFHAAIAPLSTKIIDKFAYNGVDVRSQLLNNLQKNKQIKTIADFGCGTGYSTPHGDGCIGVDVSPQMINVAKLCHPNKNFVVGNIEHFGSVDQFDVVLISFVFHEVPRIHRSRIIANALRVAKKIVIVQDISIDHKPFTDMFYIGEPFVKEYQTNICNDLYGFKRTKSISNHVDKWVYQISK